MLVSFIIVSFNTERLLIQCLKSIYSFTKEIEFEVIVVDNASTDNSAGLVDKLFPQVKLIKNEQNIGFGKANNLGIHQAVGKYIFLLNSDTYLLSNAALSFADYMDQNADVGCCGADLVNASGDRQISYGNFPSLKEITSQLGFYKLYSTYYQRHMAVGVINYDQSVKTVDYISGADMFIRKEVLKCTGLFDPEFFLYFEETELSWRIKKCGYSSVILPSVQIVHLEGGSQCDSAGFNEKKVKIFVKSRNLFYVKCYGKFSAIVAKALYLTFNIESFLIKRDTNYLRESKIIINS